MHLESRALKFERDQGIQSPNPKIKGSELMSNIREGFIAQGIVALLLVIIVTTHALDSGLF